MKILKADGTVMDLKVPNKCVTGMSDPNVATAAIAEWLISTNACWILFQNDISPEIVKIRSLPRQAISAATDALLYGRYDHEFSTEGLHLYSSADLSLEHAENIGYVRSSYVGNVVPAPAMIANSHVWNKVGIRLGNITTSRLTGNEEKTASLKHDYIEYLKRGYSLQVWIAPIRSFVAPFITQWLMEDIEDAREFRTSRLNAARLKRRELKPAGTEAWKTVQAAVQVGESVELPTEINVPLFDSEEVVNLLDQTEPVGIKLYNDGYVTTMTFDPADAQSVLTFQNLFGVDSKYSVKLLV